MGVFFIEIPEKYTLTIVNMLQFNYFIRGFFYMTIIDELQYYMDSASIGIVLELLLVTTCLSTIIYVVTKNQYISYLSSAPIFYFMSFFLYHNSHFILLIVAMTIQASVILFIQKKNLFKALIEKDRTLKSN